MGEGNKVRFDGLDVTAMVAFLKTILGRRIVNVYDGDSGETYLFKLDGEKQFLLLESGIRFHTIPSFESNGMPSAFCSKLRKHLRGLRVESVKQIGTDRVALFQFGAGPSKHCIILELYSKGNLILTDGNYNILALLRSHEYQDSVKVQVGQVYPVTYASTTSADEGNDNSTHVDSFIHLPLDQIRNILKDQIEANAKKPKKKKTVVTLKTLLLHPSLKIFHYGPALIEHCILYADLAPNDPLEKMGLQDDEWERLQRSVMGQGPLYMKKLQNEQESPGYILYTPRDTSVENSSGDGLDRLDHSDKVLQSFQPHLLRQHEAVPHVEYGTFGSAVADFFLHLDVQRRIQKIQASERAVKNKLAKVQQDQADRLLQLGRDQERQMNQAQSVKTNAVIIDQALQVINSALDSGMDWDQLEELVQVEQSRGNPVASIIQKLELDNDSMVLDLQLDPYDESSQKCSVAVSLKESAHANASRLFAKYRASKDKSQKTVEASSKALKAAKETAQKQLAQSQSKTKQVFQKRKVAWYEKFHWFITSDNYLVLAGRDAHQNETLVKRYLRPGDAYLHAEIHGAASCILRAKRRRRPDGSTQTVPLADQALSEAGHFTICRSSAWKSRMVTSAWWVESHQVSKTAPSGEYLSVGSFMVRGKKNFLPPTPLEMGLAVLFRLGDDDSIARHQQDRRDFALLQLESDDVDTQSGDRSNSLDVPARRDLQGTPVEESPSKILSNVVTEEEIDTSGTIESLEERLGDRPHLANETKEGVSEAVATASTKKLERKGFSVKERKLIKKYGSLEAAERALADKVNTSSKRSSENAPSIPREPVPQGKPKRGKKGKAKKMKKYADQDDEDRELAMLALHGGEKRHRKADCKTDDALSEAQSKVAEATAAVLVKDVTTSVSLLPERVQDLLSQTVTVFGSGEDSSKEVRWDKFDADTIEQLSALTPEEAQLAAAQRLLSLKESTRIDNFSASLSGIIRTIGKYGYEKLNEKEDQTDLSNAKRKTRVQKEAEEQEWRQRLQEEGISRDELDDGAVDDTLEISKLTGKPLQEDSLVHAVPVCAPYIALSQYALKVKLTPGNTKRGKASKQCVDMFLKSDGPKPTPAALRNRELLKKIGDNDWVQVICADVKISSAGASKTTKQKKGKAKK